MSNVAGDAGDGVDAFARLLGRQPSDSERERLFRLRDVLGLHGNDALWLVLAALQYHVTLYEAIPGRIERAAALACLKTSKAVSATACRPSAPTERGGFGWPAVFAAAAVGALAMLLAVGLFAIVFAARH